MSLSNTVCSLVDCATAAAPTAPLAPVLFSTTTVVFSMSPSGALIRRAITSDVPPGGNGTTIDSGLSGHAAAATDGNGSVAAAVTPSRFNAVRRVCMDMLLVERGRGSRGSEDHRLAHRRTEARLEKVEVAAFVGLQDVAAEHPAVATLEARRRRLPRGLAARQLVVAHLEVDAPRWHVDGDAIASLHQGERAADEGLGRAVQQAAAVAGAAHARIGQAQHVLDALLQ